jgi:SAM-dependent methyltransferase
MEPLRKPFQGLGNIVRFNWPLYVWAAGIVSLLVVVSQLVASPHQVWPLVLATLIALSSIISLLVSHYVYDRSSLYSFSWLRPLFDAPPATILNIHAGFDETSALFQAHFPLAQLQVFDFYDPYWHTEKSIQRARKAYSAYPGTQAISTARVPLSDEVADGIFLILAAHEIRQPAERIHFFSELRRVLKPGGIIIVLEHERNWLNFLAYSLGGFHFLSSSVWRTTFKEASLRPTSRIRLAHFITVYALAKDDHSA